MWAEKVRTESFLELTEGKERGQRIADFVDECTTSLLKSRFDTGFQASADGRTRSRSMGDVWVRSGGIFNPVNVKTGEVGKNGQPNLVSLKKLLRALLRDQIDSYYLLIIKFVLTPPVAARVYLVDLLEYLDYATYDAGPGQMMLKERSFYEAVDGRQVQPGKMLAQKIERLFALLEDGDQRLAENRRKDLDRLRAEFRAYRERPKHVIDQSDLLLSHE